MAIKVSGTTVIDDNRNIQNVGIITATTFSGSGSGLTGLSPNDGQDFNTGITSGFSARLTGIGSTVIEFPSTIGKQYLIYSIHAANIAVGNTEVNVISSFDFNGGERSYFGYNIPIPTGTAIELLKQPQVLNPSDRIVMRSTDFNRAGIDTGVEIYVTYEEKTSSAYFGVGLGTVGIAVTTAVAIHTATTSPSIIQSIRLTNRTDTGAYPISISITEGINTRFLVDNLIVPKYSSIELLETQKLINVNSVIKVQSDQTGTIDVQVSGKKIT
jgi:hypothetical protein